VSLEAGGPIPCQPSPAATLLVTFYFENIVLFYFAAMSQQKRKKIDQKRQKMLRTVRESCDTKTELSGMETGRDSAVTVDRKRVKAHKKLRLLPDDVTMQSASSVTAAEAGISEHSADVSTDNSSHFKRLPAQSDRNSGVVRVVRKSPHRVKTTVNIEEAVQLDVGVGSCQW